jgi:trans-aconitate 2-methyltransferase
MAAEKKNDWSAKQYLKFGNERTRPVYDLISQVAPLISNPTPRVYDLGCGPGNSTQVLLDAFPSANITGMDSSPDMLRKAKATLPSLEFIEGDLSTYVPDAGADLLFSNAVFHWLRHEQRIPTIVRLFESLNPGGVIAFQVPDNYYERSHALMRETATTPNAPWAQYFADAHVGSISDATRPDLDPIETPNEFYNALEPLSNSVNIWRTNYQHVLKDANAIVEWVRGTGLQPYLHRIESDDAKGAFAKEYEKRLSEEYLELIDGKVLLGYPRLFVAAVRK